MRIPIAEVNDHVVKIIAGGGCKTATIQQVESIENNKIKLINSQAEYDVFSGREIDPPIPGFSSELVALDGDEAERLGLK